MQALAPAAAAGGEDQGAAAEPLGETQQVGYPDEPEQPQEATDEQEDTSPRESSRSPVSEQIGGGLLAFFIVWPLTMNLLRGGPPQMLGWIKAKLINEPYFAAGSFKKNVAGQLAPGIENALGGPPPTPSQLPPRTGSTGNPIGVL